VTINLNTQCRLFATSGRALAAQSRRQWHPTDNLLRGFEELFVGSGDITCGNISGVNLKAVTQSS
jgi:hypothetical protein